MSALGAMMAALASASYMLPLQPMARTVGHGDLSMCEQPVQAMRLKDIKGELDTFGVAWRGVAFEKEELVRLLIDARQAPPAAPSADESTTADEDDAPSGAHGAAAAAAADDSAPSYDAAYANALADCMKLKVRQLREELAARQVGWADCVEKQDLAGRLAELKARAALFSRSGLLTPGQVATLDAEALRTELADARSPLLLDVFATWCGPCKLIAPQLEALAAKLGERARVVKLDSDLHPELSTELKVAGLPTLIFYREGAEVDRLEGVPGGRGELEQMACQKLGVEI